MRIGGESPSYELVPVEPSGARAAPVEGPASGKAFARALRGIVGAVDKGEALIAGASHGNLGGLDSAQLIALQAGIYRYSEAVDLVAKLVDRASNAVRTVISPH
ncbi:MAG TPA: hypothetical protein VEQ58_20805 [Polyangiaceae bacterium]|nr:hypothetical protein [Polyangiaceae bacterium]